VFFYSHLLPCLFLIGAVGIFYSYWIEKYILLRRHKIPEVVGSSIAKFYSNLIPFIMVAYAFSIFIETYEVTSGNKGIEGTDGYA